MRLLPALLLLPATAVSVAPAFGGGAPTTSAVSAEAVFAADVLALRGKGYRLADVGADWANVTKDDMRLTLTIVMAKGDRAERFVLGFPSWEAAPATYERAAVKAPDERRHYTMEADLFTTLTAPGPLTFQEGCGGDYYLSNADGVGVSIMPNDYYVVTGRATGAAAQERLAAEVASALGAGLDLTTVRADGDEVLVTLADSEGEGVLLLATLDERGAVADLEVRAVRQLYAWEGLSDGKGLARALREAGTLKAIRTDAESGRVHLELGKKRRFTVDPGRTFPRSGEWDHEGECGC